MMSTKVKMLVPVLIVWVSLVTGAQADITDGLVGYWAFEGNFNDSAGANNGTPMGDTKIVADAVHGQVAEFDGTGDYIEVPNSPSLNITGDQITLAAWVYFNNVAGGHQIIIAKVHEEAAHTDPYFSYGLHLLNGGQPRFWLRLGTASRNVPGTAGMLASQQWYHLAGVYDGSQMVLYVDGQAIATRDYTGNITAYDTVLRLGTNGGLTEQIAGKMDDVLIYNRALTQEEIQQVMQGLSLSSPALASDAYPEDGATDVPRDTVLSWMPGVYAPAVNGHRVYFSESFNDVNDGIGGITLSVNNYDPPQPLAFGTTYYWRVDEVNAPPDSTVFRGEVWSFTTEPVGYPIDAANITATASSASLGYGPEKTIDGSGLDQNDLHSTIPEDMWLSDIEPQGAWIQYEFDKVYKLHEMWVWNSNQPLERTLGFGMKNVTVEYSSDGIDWTVVADVPEFAQAPGTDAYAHDTTVDFGGAAAKYVKLTATSSWGGILYGLSEVRFFSIPMSAREPSPASGAVDVDMETSLGWRAGRQASTHDVYLNTDEQAVIDGTVPAVSVTEAGYGPLSLDLGQRYYWRIDEVNDAETPTTWQGDVWSFSTPEYLVVDDFESYNDIDPGDPKSHRIFESWIDGYGIATNGALVGYDPPQPSYVETTIVHGGKQSMPFAYDNSTALLSEATRTFDPPQDWTQHGITTLVLFFRGDPSNAGAPLYLKINGTKVLYKGGAVGTTLPLWKQWNIDLTSLGVSLKSVSTLTLGVGDGIGGAGTIFVDDIRLYAAPPQVGVPIDPGSNGLVAQWEFEGDFRDSAGTNDGTPHGDAKIVTDTQRGQVLALDGTGDYMEVPNSPALNITGDQITMTAWVWNDSVTGTAAQIILAKVASNTTQVSPYFAYGLHILSPNGQPRVWIARTGNAISNAAGSVYPESQKWYHLAGVYDGARLRLYLNGSLVSSTNATGNLASFDTVLRLGANGVLTELMAGKLDDVRIYNRALSELEIRYLVGDR